MTKKRFTELMISKGYQADIIPYIAEFHCAWKNQSGYKECFEWVEALLKLGYTIGPTMLAIIGDYRNNLMNIDIYDAEWEVKTWGYGIMLVCADKVIHNDQKKILQ